MRQETEGRRTATADSHSNPSNKPLKSQVGRGRRWRHTNRSGSLGGWRHWPSSPVFASPRLIEIPPAMCSRDSIVLATQIQALDHAQGFPQLYSLVRIEA